LKGFGWLMEKGLSISEAKEVAAKLGRNAEGNTWVN